MSKQKQPGSPSATIALNRKARHDYFIEERLEAGLALEGWEVKSLRAGRVNIQEGYVVVKDGEAWLIGANISPLTTASTHIHPDPTRSRKLLMHRQELSRLIGSTERQGYTLIPLDLHWKRGRAKLEIGLAKGKKQYDKRADKRERDWARDKERLLKHRV
jgi:SsrA-binding protein